MEQIFRKIPFIFLAPFIYGALAASVSIAVSGFIDYACRIGISDYLCSSPVVHWLTYDQPAPDLPSLNTVIIISIITSVLALSIHATDIINTLYRPKHKYDSYHKTICSREYIEWQLNTIKKIYGSKNTTTLFGEDYPVAIFPSDFTRKENCYPFIDLGFLKDKEIKAPDLFIADQRKYSKMLEKFGDVNRPNNPGYALTRADIKDGIFQKFEARLTNYRINIETCHYLEHELIRAYKKNRLKRNEITLAKLPYRNFIHGGRKINDIFNKPKRYQPQISIQAITIFKKDNVWRFIGVQRSGKVSSKKWFNQFIPGGGFEAFVPEPTNEQSIPQPLVDECFSLGATLSKEFLEELYGLDFDESSGQDPIFSSMDHKKWKQIVSSENTSIQFLGLAIDLVLLKYEMCFAIVIGDENVFSTGELKKNHETDKCITNYPTTMLEDWIETAPLMPASAGLISLALRHPVIKQCFPNCKT